MKVSLEPTNICGYKSTVCKTLNEQGVYGSTKKNIPQQYWQNVQNYG